MTGYPWQPGDLLLAADLNAAFANGIALAGGPFLPLVGGALSGNLSVGGTLGVTGAATFSVSLSSPTISNGTGLLTVQPNIAGATQIAGAMRHGPTTGAIYNIGASNITSHTDPWFVSWVSAGNAGGAGTPISGTSAINSFQITDVVQTTGGVQGINLTHNVAPNGTSASGPRIGIGVSLVQVGSLQGGTISNTSISSAAVFNMWCRSNLGGTANAYAGGLNALNITTQIEGAATFISGGSGFEIDTGAVAGTSYGAITQQLNVVERTHAVRGYQNENISLLVVAQSGALADLMYGLRFVDNDAGNPFDPKAKLVYAGVDRQALPVPAASNLDFGNTVVAAFHERRPYGATVPLQANGITTATRLTSDGQAPSGFIYEATGLARGSGYTVFPTVTVTGGTGAQVNAMLGTGNVMSKPGVYNAGTNVPAEATAAVTGTGSGATIGLGMAGNTLNFAINSAIHCEARIVMRSTTGEAICWSCEFGARMGATASTTAIIGSPTWIQVWATAGAAAAIGISAPAADTTLGAINITVTPTSLTWSGGGTVRVTKSSRV